MKHFFFTYKNSIYYFRYKQRSSLKKEAENYYFCPFLISNGKNKTNKKKNEGDEIKNKFCF